MEGVWSLIINCEKGGENVWLRRHLTAHQHLDWAPKNSPQKKANPAGATAITESCGGGEGMRQAGGGG